MLRIPPQRPTLLALLLLLYSSMTLMQMEAAVNSTIKMSFTHDRTTFTAKLTKDDRQSASGQDWYRIESPENITVIKGNDNNSMQMLFNQYNKLWLRSDENRRWVLLDIPGENFAYDDFIHNPYHSYVIQAARWLTAGRLEYDKGLREEVDFILKDTKHNINEPLPPDFFSENGHPEIKKKLGEVASNILLDINPFGMLDKEIMQNDFIAFAFPGEVKAAFSKKRNNRYNIDVLAEIYKTHSYTQVQHKLKSNPLHMRYQASILGKTLMRELVNLPTLAKLTIALGILVLLKNASWFLLQWIYKKASLPVLFTETSLEGSVVRGFKRFLRGLGLLSTKRKTPDSIKKDMVLPKQLRKKLEDVAKDFERELKKLNQGRPARFPNILCYGEPGLGKTLYLKILINYLINRFPDQVEFVRISPANLFQYSEEEITQAFEKIEEVALALKRKGCLIVWIDEIELIAPDHLGSGSHKQKLITAAVNNAWETTHHGCKVLAGTSNLDVSDEEEVKKIDAAFLNRIGASYRILFSPPTEEELLNIFAHYLKKVAAEYKKNFGTHLAIDPILLNMPQDVSGLSSHLKQLRVPRQVESWTRTTIEQIVEAQEYAGRRKLRISDHHLADLLKEEQQQREESWERINQM